MIFNKLLQSLPQGILHNLTFCRTLKVISQPSLSVTVSDMRKLLQDKGIEYKTGYTCLIAKCPFCVNKNNNENNSKKLLYVNMTTGGYVCHCQKYRGTWQDFQDLLALSKGRRGKHNLPVDSDHNSQMLELKEAEHIWKRAKPLEEFDESTVAPLKKAYNIQNITADVLKKYNAKILEESKTLIFPLYYHGNRLQGIKMLNFAKDFTGKITVAEQSIPRLDCNGLVGWHLIGEDDTNIVVTGSEADAMAVHQNTRLNALALPRGTSILPQEVLPLLEQFKKVLLWFGNDIRSWEAAKQFAKKLHPKRCFFIRPNEQHPRPIEALKRNLNLNNILKQAQPVSHKSIVSFRSLREEVFGELSHAEQVAGIKWKRYPMLNKLLKGHRRGELTVFTGPTGSGKTTFVSEYSLDLCSQGVNTLWGSFEIPNTRLAKVMLTQFSMMNLEKHLNKFDYWADKFEYLPLYFMTFHGQQSVKIVLDAMSHAVYVHDIEHIIIDNLQFMVGLSDRTIGTDRFSIYDNIIAAFRKFATINNCHLTVVIHPRKEKDQDELQTASIFGSAKAAQESDNILILQDRRLTTVKGRKYIQVAKNRFDGDLGLVPLYFKKETLTMSAVPSKTRKKVTNQSTNSKTIKKVKSDHVKETETKEEEEEDVDSSDDED